MVSSSGLAKLLVSDFDVTLRQRLHLFETESCVSTTTKVQQGYVAYYICATEQGEESFWMSSR